MEWVAALAAREEWSEAGRLVSEMVRRVGEGDEEAMRYAWSAVLAVARRWPQLFRSAPLAGQVLAGWLKSPRWALLGALVLWAAWRDEDEWPFELLTALLEDWFADRLWCDHEYARLLVQNILTAFSPASAAPRAPAPQASSAPPSAPIPPRPAQPAPPTLLEMEEEEEMEGGSVGGGTEAGGGTGEASGTGAGSGAVVRPRFSREESQEMARRLALELAGRWAQEATTRGQEEAQLRAGLAFLALAAEAYPEVRLLVAQRLEDWLGPNAPLPLARQASRELLPRLVQAMRSEQAEDLALLQSLLRLKVKAPFWQLYLELLFQALRQHPAYPPLALRHLVQQELFPRPGRTTAVPTEPNVNAVKMFAAILRVLPPGQLESEFALLLAELAALEPPLHPQLRQLLRALGPAFLRELQLARFAGRAGLLAATTTTAAAAAGGSGSGSGRVRSEALLLRCLDLACVACLLAAPSPTAPEPQRRAYLAQVAQVQRDTLAWLQGGLVRLAPGAAVAQALRKALFLAPIAAYLGDTATEEERTRLRLLAEGWPIPLLEETLLRLLALAISAAEPAAGAAAGGGQAPLAAAEALEMAELLVRRAARGGEAGVEVANPLALEYLFQLSVLSRAPEGATCSAPRFWHAALLAVALAAANPSTLGHEAWQAYPVLRALLEALLTRQLPAPPAQLAGPSAEEAGETLVYQPGRQVPAPEWVLRRLAQLDEELRLWARLYASRQPDFLLLLLQNAPAAPRWLLQILQAAPQQADSFLACLTPALLARVLLLLLLPPAPTHADEAPGGPVQRVVQRLVERLAETPSALRDLLSFLAPLLAHPQQGTAASRALDLVLAPPGSGFAGWIDALTARPPDAALAPDLRELLVRAVLDACRREGHAARLEAYLSFVALQAALPPLQARAGGLCAALLLDRPALGQAVPEPAARILAAALPASAEPAAAVGADEDWLLVQVPGAGKLPVPRTLLLALLLLVVRCREPQPPALQELARRLLAAPPPELVREAASSAGLAPAELLSCPHLPLVAAALQQISDEDALQALLQNPFGFSPDTLQTLLARLDALLPRAQALLDALSPGTAASLAARLRLLRAGALPPHDGTGLALLCALDERARSLHAPSSPCTTVPLFAPPADSSHRQPPSSLASADAADRLVRRACGGDAAALRDLVELLAARPDDRRLREHVSSLLSSAFPASSSSSSGTDAAEAFLLPLRELLGLSAPLPQSSSALEPQEASRAAQQEPRGDGSGVAGAVQSAAESGSVEELALLLHRSSWTELASAARGLLASARPLPPLALSFLACVLLRHPRTRAGLTDLPEAPRTDTPAVPLSTEERERLREQCLRVLRSEGESVCEGEDESAAVEAAEALLSMLELGRSGAPQRLLQRERMRTAQVSRLVEQLLLQVPEAAATAGGDTAAASWHRFLTLRRLAVWQPELVLRQLPLLASHLSGLRRAGSVPLQPLLRVLALLTLLRPALLSSEDTWPALASILRSYLELVSAQMPSASPSLAPLVSRLADLLFQCARLPAAPDGTDRASELLHQHAGLLTQLAAAYPEIKRLGELQELLSSGGASSSSSSAAAAAVASPPAPLPAAAQAVSEEALEVLEMALRPGAHAAQARALAALEEAGRVSLRVPALLLPLGDVLLQLAASPLAVGRLQAHAYTLLQRLAFQYPQFATRLVEFYLGRCLGSSSEAVRAAALEQARDLFALCPDELREAYLGRLFAMGRAGLAPLRSILALAVS